MTPDRSSAEIYALCRVPKAEICFVRYTLEAYEGLCVPTTLPGGGGRLRLLTSAGQRVELEAVLRALAEEVSLVVESWSEGAGDLP